MDAVTISVSMPQDILAPWSGKTLLLPPFFFEFRYGVSGVPEGT
jgi:hypothetical protein